MPIGVEWCKSYGIPDSGIMMPILSVLRVGECGGMEWTEERIKKKIGKILEWGSFYLVMDELVVALEHLIGER